jgi:Zn ribbon nucleic-acid-binding protein
VSAVTARRYLPHVSQTDDSVVPVADLARFIAGRAHFCPTCPEDDRVAYVEVDELDEFCRSAVAYAGTADYAQLKALAEAMAEPSRTSSTANTTDEMWERARAAWQAYVDWADTPAEGRP